MTLIAPIRPWRGRVEQIWWAARAQRKELFEFRFDYPVEAVPDGALAESLHFHVYSGRLFFDAMEPDAAGIPVHRSRHFRTYNPAYVAWYGLMSLEQGLRGEDPDGRGTFLRQVEWLKGHAVERPDGSVVWPYTFDWDEGACRLEAGWISSMAQGLVISCLVRAYRMTGEAHLLDLCRRATVVFEKRIEDGGVRTVQAGHVMYEEYPGDPLPRVLDGALFSLLGLYDLFSQTGDARVLRLFAEGIDGLKHALPFWDYRGKWSWYGSHGYLCPPHYNKLNAALLTALASLACEPSLRRYAEAWSPKRLTALGRVEVLLVFLVTKNSSRLRRLLRLAFRTLRSAPAARPALGTLIGGSNVSD